MCDTLNMKKWRAFLILGAVIAWERLTPSNRLFFLQAGFFMAFTDSSFRFLWNTLLCRARCLLFPTGLVYYWGTYAVRRTIAVRIGPTDIGHIITGATIAVWSRD